MAKLNKYNEKRNFAKTKEPKGVVKSEGLRYVVQHHIARADHYDFRIEYDGVLLSWAVPKGPSYNSQDKRLAIQVEDHPLDYRNFEGTIPKGEYGGGTVMLWDEGYYEPKMDFDKGLKEGLLKFTLYGSRLVGDWTLVRHEEEDKTWFLVKCNDGEKMYDDIDEYSTSIRSGRTMDEITRDVVIVNPFNSVNVELAKLINSPPQGDWLYEVKYDGYRVVAYLGGGDVILKSRNGKDYTEHFREVADSLAMLGRTMVLDGEMIIADSDGKSDFQALQSYMKNPKGNLVYVAFDLLALDGNDIRDKPLNERKQLLKNILAKAPKNIWYSRHVIGRGNECYCASCEQGLEGIVGKRADSPYIGGRNGNWVKIKCDNRQEFVIGGYTQTERKTEGISAILLGFYDKGELRYCGRAGTGFTFNSGKELKQRLDEIARQSCPFVYEPKINRNEKVVWAEPRLIAEIKFAEWTDENQLRQASYKGIREDKNPQSVVIEKAEIQDELETNKQKLSITMDKSYQDTITNQNNIISGKDIQKNIKSSTSAQPKGDNKKASEIDTVRGVKISNPNRIVYTPDITKMDVVRYYDMVAENMMPFVGDRILSVIRCHNGVGDGCFFKKHPQGDSIGTKIVAVRDDSGVDDYFCVTKPSGIIGEVQLGTIEFHVWGSKVDAIEQPDVMVFDLDPDDGMDIGTIRQGAKDLKNVLDELGLLSFVKTSGGKGYHIVVPFVPSANWDVFRDFAKSVSKVMEEKWQNRYTTNIRKEKRKGKIFIDWERNGRGATSIAPYSLRARNGAKVSMPLFWEEIDEYAPNHFDIHNSIARLKINPWQNFYSVKQTLKH